MGKLKCFKRRHVRKRLRLLIWRMTCSDHGMHLLYVKGLESRRRPESPWCQGFGPFGFDRVCTGIEKVWKSVGSLAFGGEARGSEKPSLTLHLTLAGSWTPPESLYSKSMKHRTWLITRSWPSGENFELKSLPYQITISPHINLTK